MKNKKFAIGKRSALAVAFVAANAGVVWAQPAADPAQDIFELPEGINSITEIDPGSGQLVRGTPATRDELDAAANAGQTQRGSARGIFAMPEGIKSITAIDAFNILLVQTTGEVEETVQTRVNPLEKPMRQVRFDVRVIEGPKDAFITRGHFFPPGNPSGYLVTGDSDKFSSFWEKETRGMYTGDKLKTLLQLGSARVVNVGRVETPNNMTAKLHWETSSPATIRAQNANGALPQSTILTDSLLVVLKPIFNRDGTITVEMQIKSELKSEGDTPLTGFASATLGGSEINTISNIKIGDTRTASGLRPNIAPHKDFSILPFGTNVNVDAPVSIQNGATPKPNAEEKELYVEITTTLATPAATK